MAVQLVLNFIIAVFWLFVTNSYTTNNFVLGFIFGLVLVYLLHRVLPGRFYVITLYRIIKLVIIFLIELIKANFDVLKIIIKPSINTDLKKDWQIVLLSNLITLTPGTVVLGVSDDRTKIYIHAIDFSTKEQEVESIKTSLEKIVREVGEI